MFVVENLHQTSWELNKIKPELFQYVNKRQAKPKTTLSKSVLKNLLSYNTY